MRGTLGASLVLGAIVASGAVGCDDGQSLPTAGGVEYGESEQGLLFGSFGPRFDGTIRGGGVIAQGASLAGRLDATVNASATITIAGIPVGATVQQAHLYWSISAGTDTTATIDGFSVTGTQLGSGGNTCWSGVANTTYRADVTARVAGNGAYVIAGLPSSTTATAADTDGAALVVVYQQATSGNRRRVIVRDGLISATANGEVITDTFPAANAPFAATGRFHTVVGDAQLATASPLAWNGATIANGPFNSTDGSLWDVVSFNVNIPAATATLPWTYTNTMAGASTDCILFAAGVVDWNVATCGDGLRTGGEACENGNTTNGDGCSSTCDVEAGWNCTAGPPSVCTPICGDGIRVGSEQCDQGGGNTTNGDGCSSTCQVETGWMCAGTPSVCTTRCGDGIRAGAEACDDGDTMSGDGCSMTCAVEPGWMCVGSPSVCTTRCGDGIPAGAEACDDGDTMGGDGCSMTCTVESGWTCAGTPSVCTTACGDGIVAGAEACDDGDTMSGDGCSMTCAVEPGWTCTGTAPSVCTTTCGDGVIAGAEACDDGDAMGGDGCSPACLIEPGWSCTGMPSVCTTSCGDGVIAGGEACDDGNTRIDDGCSATCVVEVGWYCLNEPSVCVPVCGDGMLHGTEACDDGNLAAADGCSGTCTVEPGWSCTGEPSTCVTGCGDGIVAGTEACDDGDLDAGDGCSATCTVEHGWTCSDSPSLCDTDCGDGLQAMPEACDDGNEEVGDGCDDRCQIEDGWVCEREPSACQPLSVAGGGCSSSGGGGGLLVMLVVGAAVWRRRRAVAAAATIVVVAVGSGDARAQVVSGSSSYPVERFRLAMDRQGVLDVESPLAPGHLRLDVGLWLGYADDPLTVRLGDDRERQGSLVAGRVGGDLVGSIGFGERLALGLAAPLVLSQSESLGSLMTRTGALSGAGLGDVAVTPKATALSGAIDVAVAATITLPTSTSDDYVGDDGVTVAPMLLVGRRQGAARILANLGYRVRSTQTMLDLAIDDELFARLGVGVRAGRADVMGEFAMATAATAPLSDYNGNHAEVRGGVGVDVVPGVRMFAAAGAGLAAGFGTPDWRALAGVYVGSRSATTAEAPRDRDGDGLADTVDTCPDERETVNDYQDTDGCPDDPDPDGDRIVNPTDQCPDDPETVNTIDDDDGCPDKVPDTDADGLSDPTDSCPAQPEDADGFEDDDGCPDDDNDQDTVSDAADRCPDVAGVVDNGGCPDTDKDGDTVVDRLDNCPDEPGTVANHGCKDKQLVVFTGSTIDLLDVVYFKTDKAVIQKRSFKLLRNVAVVVNAHPEISHVTVEGHTDDQGDDAHNKDLSQRRAQAVVDHLIANGVDAAILTPIGFGEERPIADNTSRKGRARNRRVEFKIDGVRAPSASPSTPTTAPAELP